MTTNDKIKKKIIQNPHFILNDKEIMNVLLNLNKNNNKDIIDIRDIFIKKMEQELKLLKKKYSNFLDTTIENSTSIEAVHKSVINLLNAKDIDNFLSILDTKVKKILKIDKITILLLGKKNNIKKFKNLKFFYEKSEMIKLYNIPIKHQKTPIQRKIIKIIDNKEKIFGSEIILPFNFEDKIQKGFLILSSNNEKKFNTNLENSFLLFFSKVLYISINKLLIYKNDEI